MRGRGDPHGGERGQHALEMAAPGVTADEQLMGDARDIFSISQVDQYQQLTLR